MTLSPTTKFAADKIIEKKNKKKQKKQKEKQKKAVKT